MVVSSYADLVDLFRVMENARKEQPTLVCYVDGLGYKLYQYATKKGMLPFLANNFWLCEMETVKPSLTNPAMATIITGVLPEKHGILSRKDHMTSVPTIFADEVYREVSAIIEGDSVIVNTEIFPRLHSAVNGEKIDKLIFQGTKEAIKERKRFIFAHFHGIDDAQHHHGPYSEQVLCKLKEMDEYLHALSDMWQGNFLIISDHGMHSEGNGGNHGSNLEEDMIVPFGIRMKKKKYEIEKKSNGKEIDIKSYEGYDVKEILKYDMVLYKKYKQLIFYCEDGFAVACSYSEVELGENVLLISMNYEWDLDKCKSREQDVYRLVIVSDKTSRRWCKNIIRIEVK